MNFEARRGSIPSKAVAICGNTQLGLPCCEKGEGKYCYSPHLCSQQMNLLNPEKRTLGAEELYKKETREAKTHAARMAAKTRELDDIDYEELARQLRGGDQ